MEFATWVRPVEMSKRTLNDFFAPLSKKPHQDPDIDATLSTASAKLSSHPTYPWPVPHLPDRIRDAVELLVIAEGRPIANQPDLDLLYFQQFVPRSVHRDLFEFLRSQLFFYRVRYAIKRFGKETVVNTPRYTTVFGIDQTSRFGHDDASIVEVKDHPQPVRKEKYKCKPRPIPECLDLIRRVTEACTDTQYNFCLVNYYASGSDSISFHSDDEHFLGLHPAIASFSLGAQRDFLMKHKPPTDGPPPGPAAAVKLPLASGDMVLMRGTTQANWLHSIPKRKGGEADGGRINITLRKALIPVGTENYYRYNVGEGPVYRWDENRKEMLPWVPGDG